MMLPPTECDLITLGPSIKYVTLQGEGPRRCDSLWQRRKSNSMWRHTLKKISYIWNLKLKVMFSFLWKWMYSDRRGMDKNHPGQNLPDKTRRAKPHGQKPSRTKTLCMYACTTKNWGSEMSDVLWGSRDVWQSVTGGGGSKLVHNSVTYFMDGP